MRAMLGGRGAFVSIKRPRREQSQVSLKDLPLRMAHPVEAGLAHNEEEAKSC